MEKKRVIRTKWRRFLALSALGVFVLMLLTFLVLLQSSPLWKWFQVDTASDTLLLYALTSLNFFALIIFAFIFLRSIIRLVRERRSLKLGSKLKTRLLIYFVAVSLLPIAAMATFSYLFLNRAIEKWFSRLPENVIAEARGIQQRAIGDELRKFREKAELTAIIVDSQPVIDEQNLRDALAKGDFAALEIAAPNNVVLARVERDLPVEQRRELKNILEKIREPENTEKSLADGIGFDATGIVLRDKRFLRVVSNWRDATNISAEIMNSSGEFERLKQQQTEVRQLGFSTLSLLTFLLVFAATWVAIHLGRSLTQPIKALAEASNEVTRGNLSHRVEVLAEDELGLLVDSFNQMTAQLEENRFRLEERRNYIETVLQSLSTGVISLDENNRVTTINTAAKRMLRLDAAASENLELSAIVSADDFAILKKLLTRARRLGHAGEQTIFFREQNSNDHNGDSDGFAENGSLPVAVAVTALRGNCDKAAGAVVMIEDLSELLSAQRAAAWQEVARRMAHEIKNPLTPIQLSAERIAKRFQAVPSAEFRVQSFNSINVGQIGAVDEQTTRVVNQSTDTILREVASLKAMVDEFAQFARLPHARLESGDLNEIIKQTIALYEDRLGDVRLQIELADELPAVLLDAEQMRRVFVNLIDNALEAFDDKQFNKEVSLKTSCDAARNLLFAEIADSGRGIEKTDFSKLFQPYYSTKGRGTGLGLAIVQRIINEHDGKIRAAANRPHGAKFVIELPAAS